ncbi:MAG: DUF2997 domain-containing protein [Planctomycetaceae bacterium]
MKSIVIIISPTGETQLETKGFSGSECQQASRFLEEALGQRTEERLTAEFHATQPQQQHTSQET